MKFSPKNLSNKSYLTNKCLDVICGNKNGINNLPDAGKPKVEYSTFTLAYNPLAHKYDGFIKIRYLGLKLINKKSPAGKLNSLPDSLKNFLK